MSNITTVCGMCDRELNGLSDNHDCPQTQALDTLLGGFHD